MIKSERGSVTLFLMLILSVFLLLFGIVFDFVRIRQADGQAQRAIQAAQRSVLSAYDNELLSRYGLFALTLDAAAQQRIARAVFDAHLDMPADESKNPLIMTATSLRQLEIISPDNADLSDPDIFRSQILADMKIKAPVEFGLAILEPLRKTPLKAEMQKTSTHYRMLDELEQMINKRDLLLDAYSDHVLQNAGPGQAMQGQLLKIGSKLGQLKALAVGLSDWDDSSAASQKNMLKQEGDSLAASIVQWQKQLYEADPIDKELELKIEKAEQRRQEIKQAIKQITDRLLELASFSLIVHEIEGRIERLVDEYEQFEQTAQIKLQTARQLQQQLEEKWHRYQSGAFVNIGNQESLHEAQSYWMLESNYWSGKQLYLEQPLALLQALKQRLKPDDLLSLKTYLQQHDHLLQQQRAAVSAVNRLQSNERADRQRRQHNRQQNDQTTAKNSNKISNAFAEVKELLSSCDGAEELHYARILQIGEELKKDESAAKKDQKALDWEESMDGDELAERSILSLEAMQSAFYTVRDHIYLNEYILQRFNHRLKPDVSEQPVYNTALVAQESEYLLYGFPSCTLNQAAAVMEIFTFRLGIRTAEALADPKKLAAGPASPLSTFLWAAAQSASLSVKDIKQIMSGDRVAISERWASQWKLAYEDYLRLFLLIHPYTENRMRRVQALVSYNTSIDLSSALTEIEISALINTKLLFTPKGYKELSYDSSLNY